MAQEVSVRGGEGECDGRHMGGGERQQYGCNILPLSQISVAVRMVPSSISGVHCKGDKYKDCTKPWLVN